SSPSSPRRATASRTRVSRPSSHSMSTGALAFPPEAALELLVEALLAGIDLLLSQRTLARVVVERDRGVDRALGDSGSPVAYLEPPGDEVGRPMIGDGAVDLGPGGIERVGQRQVGRDPREAGRQLHRQ